MRRPEIDRLPLSSERPLVRALLIVGMLGFLAWGALPAAADEPEARVKLRNGDRITGELLSLVGGKLKIATGYAGEVTIDVTAVAGIESRGAVTLELVDGEVHRGTLLTAPAGQVYLVTETGAEETFALDSVAAINPPQPPAVTYSGTVSLGANVQRGNTEQTSLSAAAEAVRETERNRLNLRFRWVDARERGRQTAESLFVAFKYERFFGPRFFGFTGTELLSDEFKDLDLRTALNLGVGYQVVDREGLRLAVEGGLSYLDRDFILAEDVDEVTARVAADLAWSIGPFKLTEHLLVYPSFEDQGFELRSETGLSTEVFKSWALELATVFEYDSEPTPGLEKDDLIWILGLQYGF